MRLNQHGLYTNVMRDAKGVKYNKGTLIAQRTEQEIFDALGVPYRPSNERIC
ncbi:10187_t:CDS:2 [Ambispora gerdemannii]|uniref:10187_t:CDS:1 n=1 Tax=Ambispora gerdemannii TaxID=144530 RepID=A0A9N9C8F0_9GLOM|nr:10187_t:CDS:2 [Ambispora gerdemannii]